MADVKSCGVIVFRESPQKSFLLMKHVDRWDLPKGHLDPGESELECALRELVEETGIRSSQIRLDSDFEFRHQYTVAKPDKSIEYLKELVMFLGWLSENVEIELTEHIGYEWLEWQPPHKIQAWTIDPLLDELNVFFEQDS